MTEESPLDKYVMFRLTSEAELSVRFISGAGLGAVFLTPICLAFIFAGEGRMKRITKLAVSW
jgi:hypothetical protein